MPRRRLHRAQRRERELRDAKGEPYGPSLTLGAAEVSPLDMAAAYSVFAAGGLQFPASPIVKVTDADGKVLEDTPPGPASGSWPPTWPMA